jgi:hypothetical protein
MLVMIDSPKDKAEKAKAFKKLLSKWFKAQETKSKADFLLSKNPGLKIVRTSGNKKVS